MQKIALTAAFLSFTSFNPEVSRMVRIAASTIAVLAPVRGVCQFQQDQARRSHHQTPLIVVNHLPTETFAVFLRRSAWKVGCQSLMVVKEQLG